jgi:putative endonuclease
LYLRLKGYGILAMRYRTAVGEVDLIARKGKAVIFVEVKWRPSHEDGALAIQPRQQDRIRRAAEWYLSHTGQQGISGRFDVVLVVPWRLPRHIKNAW